MLSRKQKPDGNPIYEVDISFVTDAEIAALNGEYRGRARPTDVLSFSQIEDAPDTDFNFSDFNGTQVETPEPPIVPLGDIVISIETARRQAAERGHDLATEVNFLAIHGALHLWGYDHVTAPCGNGRSRFY